MLITDLPFFSSLACRPRTIADLERGLRLSLGEVVAELNDVGTFCAPPILGRSPGTPPLSAFVESVYARYSWDVHHAAPRTSMSQIRESRLEGYEVSFTRGRSECEAWLASRHGAPRAVVAAPASPGGPSRAYRVYGTHLLLPYAGESFQIEWHERLPDWALAPTNASACMKFLSELPRVMAHAQYAQIVAFMSAPPADAGIVVTGRLNTDDYWLELAPKRRAVEVAAALGIAAPVGRSAGVHMSSWSLAELAADSLHDLHCGDWELDVGLDGWPSGEFIPRHRGCKRLRGDEMARMLCVRKRSAA